MVQPLQVDRQYPAAERDEFAEAQSTSEFTSLSDIGTEYGATPDDRQTQPKRAESSQSGQVDEEDYIIGRHQSPDSESGDGFPLLSRDGKDDDPFADDTQAWSDESDLVQSEHTDEEEYIVGQHQSLMGPEKLTSLLNKATEGL